MNKTFETPIILTLVITPLALGGLGMYFATIAVQQLNTHYLHIGAGFWITALLLFVLLAWYGRKIYP